MSRLFAIILTVFLSLPVSVWAVEETVGATEPTQVVNTLDEDLEHVQKEETIYKQPISKRKIVKKFLAAMGGVVVSSLALFFLLTLYNRIREGYVSQTKTVEGEPSLETPDDLNSAVKTFLVKTNWS